MQVKQGTDIQTWLKKFKGIPNRNMSDYAGVNLTVVDDAGKVLYSGPVQ
jgi:hypothetical protein